MTTTLATTVANTIPTLTPAQVNSLAAALLNSCVLSLTSTLATAIGSVLNLPASSIAPVVSTSSDFNPESLAPLPAAPPRKARSNGKKKRHCAVLTDTPERDALASAEAKRNEKLKPKNLFSKPAKKARKGPAPNEKEWFCVFCGGEYGESRSKEIWTQCMGNCKEWVHQDCILQQEWLTEEDEDFFCPNCQ